MSDPNSVRLTSVTGPPFITVIMNWMLFGVLSIQVYLYSQAFPHDRTRLKALVYGVYLLEIAQTILLTETTWSMYVSGFGNIAGVDKVGTVWISVCLIGGMVALLVQCFYAYRVAVISQNWIMAGFIVLMSTTSAIGAFAATDYVKVTGHISDLVKAKTSGGIPVIILWHGIGSACDVVIAAFMCYHLRRSGRNVPSSRTQALVSKLVRMTIETGVVTASVSIITFVLYYAPAFRNFTYFVAPMSMQAKLYSTTMLAVLNSRMKLGIVSESTTWRDNELAFAEGPSRDINTVRLNVASPSLSQSTNIFISMEEAIITDKPS